MLRIGKKTSIGLSIGSDGISFLVGGLKPPTDVTATVDGSDIDITWTAASSVDGYNVYQQIDGGAWVQLNGATVEALEYTLTPSVPGEYNFYVASVKGEDESDPSTETTTTEEMMVQVYSDTITGLRVSAVDGTAFVDAAAAITGYADGNHLVEIVDSAGKIASGVLKAQGAGEAQSTIYTESFDTNLGSWGRFNGSTVVSTITHDTNKAVLAVTTGGDALRPIVQHTTLALTEFGLLVSEIDYELVSGNLKYTRAYALGGIVYDNIMNYTFSGTDTLVFPAYTHPGGTGLKFFLDTLLGVCVLNINEVRVKQVTAPSTSGATLVDALFGTDYNFFNIETGFAYNQASYLIRVKKILPTA